MECESSISDTFLKLLPFLKATAAYFTTLYFDLPLILHVAAKCAPIICLGLFVLHYPSANDEQKEFKKWILGGLAMSCSGDFCLPFEEFFLMGMLSFGLAHYMYLRAFGLKPLRPQYGVVIFFTSACVLMIIMKCIQARIIFYAVPIYASLLGTMCWRSLAQLHDLTGHTNWSRMCTASGGILWLISDGALGFDKFCSPLPYSSALIMGTYYSGQAAIALSIVDCWRK